MPQNRYHNVTLETKLLFDSGGPVPKDTVNTMHAAWQPLGFVSNWGGMEVGNGTNVVINNIKSYKR